MADYDIRAQWLSAQAGCIGSVLQAPELAGQLLSETGVDDFDAAGRVIYQAIGKLFAEGTNPDAVQVGEATGGVYNEFLLQCLDVTPSAADLPRYIGLVKNKSRLARLRGLLQGGADARSLEEVQAVITQANDLLVSESGRRGLSMEELMVRFYNRKKQGETYIPTGMRVLDGKLYLSRGDYVVIAGRPSRGKTVLALQFALAQSQKYRVGFFSFETDEDKLMDRLLCHASDVDMEHIKLARLDQGEWKALWDTNLAKNTNFRIYSAAGMTVDDVFHMALADRLDIIYMDYLQIVSGSGNSRYEIVTGLSVRVHQLAQKHKIMTVVLSQLSRAEKSKSDEADMDDLRESGQIEQDADAILMLYLQNKKDPDGNRELKIAKNKEGTQGRVELRWEGAKQTFTPLSHRTPPPLPRYRRLPDDTPVPSGWDSSQTTIEEG